MISPATTQSPVVTRTSHATRPVGSSFNTASRTASEIWSAILSGCPSVTDSDVNICLRLSAIFLIGSFWCRLYIYCRLTGDHAKPKRSTGLVFLRPTTG